MKVLSEAEQMAASYPDDREHSLLWLTAIP